MKKILSIIFILSILFAGILAYSQENEVFEYQKAVISSLRWAKEAHDLLKSKPHSDEDWETIMHDTVFAQDKIKKAIESIEGFSVSKNELIKSSQEVLAIAFVAIDLNHRRSIEFIEKLLNGEKKDRGSNAREMASIGLQADDSWKDLLSATIVTTYCLIDENRKIDGKASYLLITKKQRDELIKELKSGFGEVIKDGPKGGQFSHEAAAASIYAALVLQGFKMADE